MESTPPETHKQKGRSGRNVPTMLFPGRRVLFAQEGFAEEGIRPVSSSGEKNRSPVEGRLGSPQPFDET